MTAYDEAYSEYLKDKEPIIVDGRYYYKVIYKERLSFEIRGCRCISVMLPAEIFRVQWGQIVEDENGRQFELVGPESMRFSDGIPEWHLKTFIFLVKNVSETDEIGDYLRVV